MKAQKLNLPLPSTLTGIEEKLPFVLVVDEAFWNDNLMKPYSGTYDKGSIERQLIDLTELDR